MSSRNFLSGPTGSGKSLVPYVPLFKKEESVPTTVLCGGHKFIAGWSGSGVYFFTKYLLLKAYPDATVLWLDASNTFGTASLPNQQVDKCTMPVHERKLEDRLSDHPLMPGISVVNVVNDCGLGFELLMNLLNDLIALLNQPGNSRRILVLDWFWTYAITQQVLPFLDVVRYLLMRGRKYNLELWLLTDGNIYFYKEPVQQKLTHQLLQHINQYFLLSHPFPVLQGRLSLIQSLYGLTEADMEKLSLLNSNLNPALLPYREVLVKQNFIAENSARVYGIVATPTERKQIG